MVDRVKYNKKFLQSYIAKLDKKTIRDGIKGIVIYLNVIIPAMINLYDLGVYSRGISNDELSNCFKILAVIDIFSVIYYIFAEKLEKISYFYIGLSFWGSSVYILYLSTKIFLKTLERKYAVTCVFLELLIYIILIFLVIRNVRKKLYYGLKKVKVNTKIFASVITGLGIIIIRFITRNVDFEGTFIAIPMIIFSYLFTPLIIQFHKFYLVIKNR